MKKALKVIKRVYLNNANRSDLKKFYEYLIENDFKLGRSYKELNYEFLDNNKKNTIALYKNTSININFILYDNYPDNYTLKSFIKEYIEKDFLKNIDNRKKGNIINLESDHITQYDIDTNSQLRLLIKQYCLLTHNYCELKEMIEAYTFNRYLFNNFFNKNIKDITSYYKIYNKERLSKIKLITLITNNFKDRLNNSKFDIIKDNKFFINFNLPIDLSLKNFNSDLKKIIIKVN